MSVVKREDRGRVMECVLCSILSRNNADYPPVCVDSEKEIRNRGKSFEKTSCSNCFLIFFQAASWDPQGPAKAKKYSSLCSVP